MNIEVNPTPTITIEPQTISSITVEPQTISSITIQTSGVVTIGAPKFEFEQTAPSQTWNITHNLQNPRPSIYIEDLEGNEVIGTYIATNYNSGIINFLQAISGKAYLS